MNLLFIGDKFVLWDKFTDKIKIICIFCTLCPLDLSGAGTIIFLINSFTIVGYSNPFLMKIMMFLYILFR